MWFQVMGGMQDIACELQNPPGDGSAALNGPNGTGGSELRRSESQRA